MKLYTEEQVKQAFQMGHDHGTNWIHPNLHHSMQKLTPISLPSDEEIKQYSIGYALVNEDVSDKLGNYLVSAIHIDGAMWFKKQILNQKR